VYAFSRFGSTSIRKLRILNEILLLVSEIVDTCLHLLKDITNFYDSIAFKDIFWILENLKRL